MSADYAVARIDAKARVLAGDVRRAWDAWCPGCGFDAVALEDHDGYTPREGRANRCPECEGDGLLFREIEITPADRERFEAMKP